MPLWLFVTTGLSSAFASARLRVIRLWPSYDTLHSLAVMGRYPKVQRLMIESVYRLGHLLPVMSPRKFFRWTEREKEVDELHRAGSSICFLAVNGAE